MFSVRFILFLKAMKDDKLFLKAHTCYPLFCIGMGINIHFWLNIIETEILQLKPLIIQSEKSVSANFDFWRVAFK